MSIYNLYPKGSEWRKWDLHVHAPTKFTCAKNDQYQGKDLDEKQNIFIEDLKKISDVSVLGATDYFSLDAYKLIIKNQNELSFDLILPNIEMRITPVTGDNRKINLHMIPNMDALDIEEVERFLYKFEFGTEKLTCRASDLIKLGKNTDAQLSDEKSFKKGLNEFCISYEYFFNTFNNLTKKIRNNIIIGVSNSNNDGASGIKDLQEIRNVIYRGVDFIFSSRPSDKEYFLGEGVDSKESIISKYGKLLPCIHGSDYHGPKNGRSLCVPDLNRFCWLKTDPTFEGLKQIKYEAAERISISEDKPDDKRIYQLIDKVVFEDDSFTTSKIEINQNLTAIIGGKSTGKSILLRNIAKSIDPEEYKKRLESVNLIDPKPINSMTVFWKDGQVSKLGADDNPNKRIIYIPQSYLNRVVDNDYDLTDIDEIIKDVLLQDDDFQQWYSQLADKEKIINNDIERNIRALYENFETFKEKRNELKKVGDEIGIQEQIKRIKQEIEDIQKKINLSQEQIKKYNDINEKIKKDRVELSILEEDIRSLNRLKVIVVSIYNQDEYSFKSEELANRINNITKSKTLSYSEDWKNEILKLIKIEENKSDEMKSKIYKAVEDIKDLQNNIDNRQHLVNKYSELEKEQEKELIIENLKKQKEEANKNINLIIDMLCDETAEYYSIYLEVKDLIQFDNIDEELAFEINTVFQRDKFDQIFIQKYFDGRQVKSAEYDYLTNFNFQSKDKYKKYLKNMIRGALKDNLPIKGKEINSKEVITALLKNWFIHSYKVEYDGDKINDMSPGKKSFVLLRLLIDLDRSECPILIDQPEDDLDNRSIYIQVVQFLRKKKSERQVIIATHNPNLVLGADAELIIVANQQGKNSRNKKYTFEFVSGSIEHSTPEDDSIDETLYKKGTQEHICDVLEGGKEAFNKRKNKYSF